MLRRRDLWVVGWRPPGENGASGKDDGDGRQMSYRAAITETRFCSGVIAMVVCGVLSAQPSTSSAQTSEDAKLAARKADAEQFFRDHVAPFVKSYCLACHSSKRPTEAGVNFTPALKSPGDWAFSQQWKKAIARVKGKPITRPTIVKITATNNAKTI